MIRVLPVVMVAIMASACSSTCAPPALPGKYLLKDGNVLYTLQLDQNHAGSLLADGRLIGPVKWEWHSENDQVFVQGSRDVLDRLLKLRRTSVPEESKSWVTGYFGLSASCALFLRSVRLDIDGDGSVYFEKSASQ